MNCQLSGTELAFRKPIGNESVSLDIDIVRDPDEFRALEPAWNALFERAGRPHYFCRFDWLWSAWKLNAGPKGRKLFVVVGRSEGQIVLIWPLAIEGKRLARFVASDRGEYRDAMIAPGPSSQQWLTQAFETLRSEGGVDILHLQDVRPDSQLVRFFQDSQFGARRHIRTAPFIPLDEWPDFADYLASLPRKLRADQRRQWRRISEKADVAFELVESREDVFKTIDWLFQQKLDWMSRNGMTSPSFDSDEYRNFLRKVCSDGFDNGSLVVTKILSDDDTVSASIGFQYDDEFTFYMFSYDPKWGGFSPGRLLLEKNIEWAKEHGVSHFDVMLGTADYKERWTEKSSQVNDFLIPCSSFGVLMVAWYRSALRRGILGSIWRKRGGQFKGRVPRPLRMFIEAVLLSRWGDPFGDG